jgi:protein-L-isoaspartate(D-aspartate) O-methyltransferase
MVEQQLKSRDINDPEVLQAMLQVKRHLFVPEASRDQAYRDRPLPLVKGQTISQPYIVALMTQLAHLEPEEKVLEIGTGSGYQAAILSRLCRHVYSIEIIDQLAKEARQRLKKLGFANIHIKTGDGFKGWKEHAPYDAIIVTCAPPAIPPPLIAQLAESGRLVVPVGRTWQELIVLTKKSGTIHKERIIPVRFVPMTGSGVQTINPGTQ